MNSFFLPSLLVPFSCLFCPILIMALFFIYSQK